MDLVNTTVCRDDQFGPTVTGDECRGGFDFTLLFQESILTLLPAIVFLISAGPRGLYLLRRSDKTRKRATYAPKLVTSCALAVSQIALLALTASTKLLNTRLSIAVAVFNVLTACSIIPISHVEHVKTIRPSFLLTAYLVLSAMFDAARIRTEWLLSVNVDFAAVLSASLACKVALLVLETIEKQRILIDRKTPPSSESTSGPLNRGLFLWLNSLFFHGWKGNLALADIPSINEKLDSASVAARFDHAGERALRGKNKRRLFLATVKAVKWDVMFIVPPRLALIALRLSQPFLISHALRYLTTSSEELSKNVGYGLIGAFALVFIRSALIQAWYEHLIQRTGAIVRGGLITLIYPKMIRLPTVNLNQSSAVALMGNDVETLVDRLRPLLIEWWAGSLTVGVAMWMLASQLGAVCVVPIIAALGSLAMSSFVGKAMGGRLMIYQQAAQDRLNFTTQVVSSIKAVKMLGFVESFTSMVKEKRRRDISGGRRFRWLLVADNAITNIATTQTQTIAFGAYAIVAKLSGSDNFTAAQAAVVLSILNVMLAPLRDLLGAVTASVSAFAAFESSKRAVPGRVDGQLYDQYPSIQINNGCFSWGQGDVLQDVNTTIGGSDQGSLTMVIGPVGSGKSNFLKSLLGEISCSKGCMNLTESNIAFCDQTPWLINATLRENVVAESGDFDEMWFDTVIGACDLITDFASFAKGADTIVGDNGVKLSGGQKQRVAIARAIYSRKRIAIFDDVFSGLDKITEQKVFASVFAPGGLLRKNGITVVLATHNVNRLPQSDYVIALDSGSITQQGHFRDLELSHGYVSQLNVRNTCTDSESGRDEDSKSVEETKKIEHEAQTVEETKTAPADRSIFMYYFRAVKLTNVALLLLVAASAETAGIVRFVMLTWWGDGRGRPSNDLGYWLSLYATLGVLQDALVIGLIVVFLVVFGPVSGYILHNRVLDAVMNAPMSFLSNVENGNLINRFSQDMRLIDFDLPVALGVFLANLCSCFGAAGLAIGAVTWFALSVPPVLLLMVLIQRFYVRTSKQLRLLEIEHKAPLYSHFLESITGLATIRAFGWTSQYQAKNLRLLDDAQKPSYLMGCIQRWLALVMELIVGLLTVLLVTLAITLKGRFPPSLLGIALVNMMNLGDSLQGVMIHWSALETSLGAVSRVKTFSETTPSESSAENNANPPDEWPESGTLVMQDVSLTYNGTDELALRNVSLSLSSGERVGLCGRSGSGKSSVVQAILRMVDITGGQMTIDGQDLMSIARNQVRNRMSCLTQEPFLFNDTVRFNMDPTGEHEDADIVNALERVGLWALIVSKSDASNKLDERMDGTFLSHGQRQIFCLGRALLKKSQFLILDEPTSNVDKQTDAQMQQIIRDEFQGRTILMIAHRLNTLMDFDKIIVMDQGRIVESGAPSELLNRAGVFAKLYHADGH